MFRWFRKYQTGIFLLVLLADGMLFGTTLAVMKGNPSRYETVFALGQEQLSASTPGQEQPVTVPGQPGQPGSTGKVVALTFDDGPHEKWTARLLDGLRERGVKASFFLMGQNIEGNEQLVQQMQEDGHLIGNHSFRHIPLTKAREDDVCQAVDQTEKLIEEITGVRPQYLRPPYGDWNEDLECRLDLTTTMWTLDSLDWKLKNTDAIVRRVESTVKNGDIILMHDVFLTSVDAALQLVDRLKAQGYCFVTVDELLID